MALVLLFFLFNILGEFGLAALVNRTIDDYFGDPITGTFPIYSPANLWQQGNGCTGCLVQPDVSKAFDGTWHDSTFLVGGATRTVSVTFTGSAVYAFFITPPTIPGVNSSLIETHLNITLDGNLSGSFDSLPSSNSDYVYNQLVYGNASLNYGKHTLVISSGGPSRSILEFDYVIYTTDDGTTPSLTASIGSPTGISAKSSNPSSATSSHTAVLPDTTSSSTATHRPAPIGAIVGGVLGGVAIIALIIFIYFYFYRNRDRSTAHEVEAEDQAIPAGPQTPRTLMVTPTEIDPFVISPSQASFGTAEKQHLRHTSSSTRTTVDPRQVEMNRRVQELQREMALLQSQNSSSSHHLPLRTEQADDWRSNVELLRAEVERLRLAMHSSQGLTDRPPDYAYSPWDEITSSGRMSS